MSDDAKNEQSPAVMDEVLLVRQKIDELETRMAKLEQGSAVSKANLVLLATLVLKHFLG